MKKTSIATLLSIVLIAASAIGSHAKTKYRKLSIVQTSVPETETLATGNLEFVYDYRHSIDTTSQDPASIVADDMLLQIAPSGLSKFSSYRNLAVDSIISRSSVDQLTQAAASGKLSNGEFMTIYKNLPSGHLTHTELICRDWLRYEEELPALSWELTDSTATVLGYRCRAARCEFRGRQWTAFYAEDIPVADGPWKLHGLPGLIMKAHDAANHYQFECKGIRSNSSRPVTIYKVPFNKTNRRSYYLTKNRYEVNPYGYFEATTGSHITVTDQAGNPQLDAYNPLELPYDYIERDWKK